MFTFLNSLIYKNATFDSVVFFLAVTLPYITFASTFVFLFFVPTSKDYPKWWRGLPRRMLKCVHAGVAVGVSYLITSLIKNVAHISRPFEGPNGIQALFLHSGGDSFPSGHATAFSALATVVYFHSKPAGIIFWAIAILISLARVTAGVHYPIDIAFGLAIGGLTGFFLNRLWRKISIATTY
jgi:membrane-associated phospholipid phosphatase